MEERAPSTLTADDHVHALRRAWESDLLRDRKEEKGSQPWKPPHVYASRIRTCARAMALDLLHPEDDPFDQPLTLERFEQGNESERATIARLHRIGPFTSPQFEVSEQQHKFEVRDRDGVTLIRGKMDGRLRFKNGACPPIEIKSGRSYEQCDSVEDLAAGVWSKGALDQLLAYLYADDRQKSPRWGIVLIRRQSDFPSLIRVNLEDHLERVEAFLQRARLAVDARHQRGPLPDFIQDVGECRRCPHLGKSCSPPMDFGPGVHVVTDPALISAAETRYRNRMARDEYERADKKLKDALRGVDSALVGNFQVAGHWEKRKKAEIPPEVKAQYERDDPHGAWKMTIEKLP